MGIAPSEPGRLVFTVDEVAERLGVHANTVREMINEGAFRARRVGRVWKVPVSAFGEFLEGRDNPAQVLSMDEVALALGIHRDTVSAMLNAGTIRALRVGKTWKVPMSSLAEYLAGRDNPDESKEITQPMSKNNRELNSEDWLKANFENDAEARAVLPQELKLREGEQFHEWLQRLPPEVRKRLDHLISMRLQNDPQYKL